jgi:phage recombination protein Bet
MSEETKTEEKKEDKHQVVTYDTGNGNMLELTMNDVFNVIASGTQKPTYGECVMFMQLCKAQKLNPFLKEAYLVKYSQHTPAQLVVSKDAFEKRANACPVYTGKDAGVILLRDEKVVYQDGAFQLPGDELLGGWCNVHRSDREKPISAKVSFDEYVGKKKDGTVNQQWEGKPLTMIRKVAIVQALREAFPDQLDGLYIGDEMQHAQNPSDKEVMGEKAKQSPSPAEIKIAKAKLAKEKENVVDGEVVSSVESIVSAKMKDDGYSDEDVNAILNKKGSNEVDEDVAITVLSGCITVDSENVDPISTENKTTVGEIKIDEVESEDVVTNIGLPPEINDNSLESELSEMDNHEDGRMGDSND